jgi:hypothetical protein
VKAPWPLHDVGCSYEYMYTGAERAHAFSFLYFPCELARCESQMRNSGCAQLFRKKSLLLAMPLLLSCLILAEHDV